MRCHLALVAASNPHYVYAWRLCKGAALTVPGAAAGAGSEPLAVLRQELERILVETPESVNQEILRAVAACPGGMAQVGASDGDAGIDVVWAVLAPDIYLGCNS